MESWLDRCVTQGTNDIVEMHVRDKEHTNDI